MGREVIDLCPTASGTFETPERRYVIDAAEKTLKVLDALAENLEGTKGLPIKEIAHYTGLSSDFCMRALHTLRAAGYAYESPTGWKVAPRLTRFSDQYATLLASAAALAQTRANQRRQKP